MPKLFEPTRLGSLKLNNRVIMAPMTRSRASEDGTPTEMMVDYYRQRANAGMIIAEGTYPSENGKGYCRTPGIVSEQHIASWKKITDAVHDQDGTIVLQLMHCGRCSHSDNKGEQSETVAPSAIPAEGEIFTEEGMKPFSSPRALLSEEIPVIIEQYRQATINAYAAGFDGVELHGASGYLPAQFLSPGSNTRDDNYGGSLANRLRFTVDVLEAMSSVNGADRVGLRICPGFPLNDTKDPNPLETFEALLAAINPMHLAYLHTIRASPLDVISLAQNHFNGPHIINGGYERASAEEVIAENNAAAVSFGSLYIANPDLVNRLQCNAALASADPSSLYTATREGYSDYPTLDSTE